MRTGWCKATANTQWFLDRCEAVQNWEHLPETDTFIFTYDEDKEAGFCPEGINWNCENMPNRVVEECENSPSSIWWNS